MHRLGIQILISDFVFQRIWKAPFPHFLRKRMVKVWSENGWNIITLGAIQTASFDLKSIVQTHGENLSQRTMIAEIFLAQQESITPSPIGAAWLDIIGCREIPFDPKTRRDKLQSAYETLSEYVGSHETLKRQSETGGVVTRRSNA
jgi:hypothetical protein